MSDPYLDPESGILRSKFGISDQESLDRVPCWAMVSTVALSGMMGKLALQFRL